jgi:hypothetical protein
MAMIVSRMSHQRTWDKDDRELQSFLGLALWELEASEPKFGAGRIAPLHRRNIEIVRELIFDPEKGEIVGDDNETEEMLLTPPKLAWHFGHMDWPVENIKHLLRKSGGTIQGIDFDERWFLSAEGKAVEEFRGRRTIPLSRAALALDYPLYVQYVPPRILDFNLETSKFFAHSEERGLCTLPATLRSAEHYNLTEHQVRLFAPQVIWVINYRCCAKTLRTPEEFLAALDGWPEFVEARIRSRLYDMTRKSRSQLLTQAAEQLLLS